MAMKFENKKLNKVDHAKIDKAAGAVKTTLGAIAALTSIGVVIKKVPWKKVVKTISKTISKS